MCDSPVAYGMLQCLSVRHSGVVPESILIEAVHTVVVVVRMWFAFRIQWLMEYVL